jgi:hypothetical protein
MSTDDETGIAETMEATTRRQTTLEDEEHVKRGRIQVVVQWQWRWRGQALRLW